MPVCRNNGMCIQPGQCQCPDNFVGPYCEQEKKLCVTPPPLPKNSRRSCSSTACTVTCAQGHRFPDGTSITNLMCKDGKWVPSRPELAVVPDCQREYTMFCLALRSDADIYVPFSHLHTRVPERRLVSLLQRLPMPKGVPRQTVPVQRGRLLAEKVEFQRSVQLFRRQ